MSSIEYDMLKPITKINVLVTGGSGMVGMNIKDVISQTYKIRIINDKHAIAINNTLYIFTFLSSHQCDLRHSVQVNEYFSKGNFNMIIHLAAVVGGLYKNMSQNCEMLIDNLKINTNVIEACHKYNINRGIFCLSSCIYPKEPKEFPMNEDQICSSEPHDSNEGYAYAKRMLCIMCKHYSNQYNREYICVSPVNLYGIQDNFNIHEGHVIPGLINRMYKTMHQIEPYNNNYFEVYGKGIAMRQFLFARDFADILIKILLRQDIKSGIINICDDNEYLIKDIVELIAKHFNFKQEIKYNAQYSDGIIKKTISNEKFKHLFPDYAFTSIDNGIKTTIDWYNLTQMLENSRE